MRKKHPSPPTSVSLDCTSHSWKPPGGVMHRDQSPGAGQIEKRCEERGAGTNGG